MVRILRSIELGSVARNTIHRFADEHIIGMTGYAPLNTVRAEQWELCLVVVVEPSLPGRRCVTRLAVGSESRRRMIRTLCRDVCRLMARDTRRRNTLEYPVLMTVEAGSRQMGTREGEACLVVLESCPPNCRSHLMALHTVGRKAGNEMVGRLRACIVGPVTAVTIKGDSRVLLEPCTRMT